MKDCWTQGNNPRQVIRCGCFRFLALLVAALVLVTVTAEGGPLITYSSPTDFFTNVAARLLRSELGLLNLDLNNIQVYPTNQYTPAVHRILQVTANLYDSTTNRTLGLTPEYPYCPSVFRPLFRRVGSGTNDLIVIAGYREVVGTSMATPRLAPMMIELDGPNPLLTLFPPYGAAFSSLDRNEPMVSGIPLIIAARKGFPNFNELAMQTQIYVSRLLEFRRAPGNPQTSPVIRTNQMYVIGISNSFGLEAWNSYLTNYPRDLQLIASAFTTAMLTNELGGANVVVSNRVVQSIITNIPAGSWPGWTYSALAPSSTILPFGTTNGFNFLSNSTALDQAPWLEPQTHIFPVSTRGAFYVPHWWLNLNTRLLFILVDTQANRIVDYVNLNYWESTLDVTAKLQEGNSAVTNAADYKNPANEWVTNRLGSSTSPDAPSFGVLNQIQVGINGTIDWQSYIQDPFSGLDAESAVDGFRYNLLGLSPIYFGKTFYKSNVFYAPFDPYRPIYVHTSWQANDPLVHFLPSDLIDLSPAHSNHVDFQSSNPPLPNLGRINNRFRPWGGNPMNLDPATDFQTSIKDPGIYRSDSWDFPTNQSLGVDWVGRIHRGTPWQTIFLKSTNILLRSGDLAQDFQTWVFWSGDGTLYWQPGQPFAYPLFDAFFIAPTNDWHLVSTLNALFNTNSPQQLISVNNPSAQSWEALLNGITILTNVSSAEFDPVVMSGNSPQAAIVAQAILQNRFSQPGQLFRSVGDILSTPELTMASPWLNPTNLMTDEALESIPSQLLPLLRPDSIGNVAPGAPTLTIQLTGIDGYSYTIQVSSNLLDWTTLATNTPLNGRFNFFPPPSGVAAQFFRSKLLP